MRKVIAFIDDNESLRDKNNLVVAMLSGTTFEFEDAEEHEKTDEISRLISLGVTPDDLIKLKANGIL